MKENENEQLAKTLEESIEEYRGQLKVMLNGLSIDTALMILNRATTELKDRRAEMSAIKSGERLTSMLKHARPGGD